MHLEAKAHLQNIFKPEDPFRLLSLGKYYFSKACLPLWRSSDTSLETLEDSESGEVKIIITQSRNATALSMRTQAQAEYSGAKQRHRLLYRPSSGPPFLEERFGFSLCSPSSLRSQILERLSELACAGVYFPLPPKSSCASFMALCASSVVKSSFEQAKA